MEFEILVIGIAVLIAASVETVRGVVLVPPYFFEKGDRLIKKTERPRLYYIILGVHFFIAISSVLLAIFYETLTSFQ